MPETPSLDDVIVPQESPTRDRTQHAKDPHPSDELLAHRVQKERDLVAPQRDPWGASLHPAAE